MRCLIDVELLVVVLVAVVVVAVVVVLVDEVDVEILLAVIGPPIEPVPVTVA
jgi:hypothetical protein